MLRRLRLPNTLRRWSRTSGAPLAQCVGIGMGSEADADVLLEPLGTDFSNDLDIFHHISKGFEGF